MTAATPSTGSPLGKLRLTPLSNTTASPSPTAQPISSTPLSPLRTISRRFRRVLDFDLETVAAGFADPDWVPQTITAWAYCWIGTTNVHVSTLAVADFYDLDARQRFLEPLVAAIRDAGMVTGHNILRFDLPVLNADCMRVGMASLPAVLAQDTIKLPKSKGFKKGQDVLADLVGVEAEKLPLHWGAWARGYADTGMSLIRERVSGDVVQHMQLRDGLRARGLLSAPRMWRP